MRGLGPSLGNNLEGVRDTDRQKTAVQDGTGGIKYPFHPRPFHEECTACTQQRAFTLRYDHRPDGEPLDIPIRTNLDHGKDRRQR